MRLAGGYQLLNAGLQSDRVELKCCRALACAAAASVLQSDRVELKLVEVWEALESWPGFNRTGWN